MFNKEELINHLEKNTKVLQHRHLKDAFTAIDRKDFVLEDYEEEAYEDYPLPIGYEQTISQPTTVAFMLELLDLNVGESVLDVGSGSGWTTALMAYIVGNKGKVIGVEIIPQLVEFGKKNLSKYSFKNAKIVESEKVIGLPKEAPFDKILVSAFAQDVPKGLLEQLSVGGTMIIPIFNAIWQIKKKKDETIIKKFQRFEFVPLIT